MRLVTARPNTTSARGLSFSARKRAVMTPVESRTHTISTSGTAASMACLNGPSWSFSMAVYIVSLVRCAEAGAMASIAARPAAPRMASPRLSMLFLLPLVVDFSP
jgi:hypothetical protein